MADPGREKAPSHDYVVPKAARGSQSTTTTQATNAIGQSETIEPPADAQLADPFGAEVENGVNYRTLRWWQCGLLLIAETVSLGILSLPSVVAKMGFVPGVLFLAGIGILATYTGLLIGQFKEQYPSVHSFADAGFLICGKPGEIFAGIIQSLMLIFICAAHILTFSIMMNVLTGHATCTLVFALIGMLISFLLTLPRTLENVSHISVASCLSITAAIIITMIGIAIKRPEIGNSFAIAPSNTTSVQLVAQAISEIIIAYTGHVAFFGFIAELKQPRDFPKALALLQVCAVTFYVTVGVVIYYYAGRHVLSPAIGSAGDVVKKIAYGVAVPTIVVAGVINAHVCVKNLYIRMWRGTDVVREKSFRSYASWVGLTAGVWVIAYLIACAIPVFNQLLGLLGALLCSWFTIVIPPVLWWYMHREDWSKGWKNRCLSALNLLIFLAGLALCILGTWGSAKEIADKAHKGGPFSCADNSLDLHE